MTDEPNPSASVAASPGAAEALAYAHELLEAETDRTARMDLQGHRMLITAWPWFAVVQAGLILAVVSTDDDRAGSGPYLLMVGAGIVSALAFATLLVSASRVAAVADDDGVLPASMLDSLVIRNAADPPVDQAAVMLQVSARRLADRRRANVARAGRLSAMRGAWVWTMVAALAELAFAVSLFADTVSG